VRVSDPVPAPTGLHLSCLVHWGSTDKYSQNPTALYAAAFVAGAVLAFASVGLSAFGSLAEHLTQEQARKSSGEAPQSSR